MADAPRRTLRLKAPVGGTEAHYGEENFPISEDGTVDVPPEAAAPLIAVSGFALETAPLELTADTAAMIMPGEKSFSVSFDGTSYAADANGIVVVPVAAVAELLSHGLAPYEVPAAPAKATFAPK
jgi:hypothetical protein